METRITPHFVFIWMPNRATDGGEKNELPDRMQHYTSAMSLLRNGSRVEHQMLVVQSLGELVTAMRPIHKRLPVFVLSGHGDPNTGAMQLWNGDVLTPTTLLMRWHCSFRCDVIATACGANSFCSVLQYPILINFNRDCRFIAAAEPNSPFSYFFRANSDGDARHLELTQLLLHYLRIYDDGGRQKSIKEADAFVQQRRRTNNQRRAEEEQTRLKKLENDAAVRLNTESLQLKMEREQLLQWVETQRAVMRHDLITGLRRARWWHLLLFFEFMHVIISMNARLLLAYLCIDAILCRYW